MNSSCRALAHVAAEGVRKGNGDPLTHTTRNLLKPLIKENGDAVVFRRERHDQQRRFAHPEPFDQGAQDILAWLAVRIDTAGLTQHRVQFVLVPIQLRGASKDIKHFGVEIVWLGAHHTHALLRFFGRGAYAWGGVPFRFQLFHGLGIARARRSSSGANRLPL